MQRGNVVITFGGKTKLALVEDIGKGLAEKGTLRGSREWSGRTGWVEKCPRKARELELGLRGSQAESAGACTLWSVEGS